MGIFRITEKDKLKLFRQHFRATIASGVYPVERHEKLFQWCQKVELDWSKAQNYVFDDALHLLHRCLTQVVSDKHVTLDEIVTFRQLQRRLNITDEEIPDYIQRFYDLVERKIKDKIIERVAYFSALPAVESLKQELSTCGLPDEREERLRLIIDRQHSLAKLTAGYLPVISASVELYKSEACHFEGSVLFLSSHGQRLSSGEGLFVVTSQRIMVLSTSGGWSTRWCDLQGIQYRSDEWLHVGLPGKNIELQIIDAQYIATLIINGQRVYNAQPPTPIRPNQRLS